MSTRVVLADDDVLLREGLASLLERAGFDVLGQCGDASELIAFVKRAVVFSERSRYRRHNPVPNAESDAGVGRVDDPVAG
jgi:AmiR/NasT family two-component response regulator